MAKILFNGVLHVHYGQAYVVPEDSAGFAMEAAFRGQKNGLCGASVPECLFLITGLHTGGVQFRVELHKHTPPDIDDWADIVEVPFLVSGPVILQQWAAEAEFPLLLPKGKYRARYAANNMDKGKEIDTDPKGPDSYLLQFWPAATQTSDAIIKQTSECAKYWHDAAPRMAERRGSS
jgi:hypothetical protein